MRFGERVSVFIVAIVLNVAIIAFGVILVLQGAMHKISEGAAEIRNAIVERATDPFWFWVSVGFDAFVGTMLVAGGIYGMWLTFRRKSSSARRGDTG
jgi:hypothetical protein